MGTLRARTHLAPSVLEAAAVPDEGLPRPLDALGFLPSSSPPGTLTPSLTCGVSIDLQSELAKWERAAHLWPTPSPPRRQSEQTPRGRRGGGSLGDGSLPYRWNREEIMQRRLCRNINANSTVGGGGVGGKITWQGFALTFPLRKTNISRWANTHLTRLTLQEHPIYRTINMIKTLFFLDWLKGSTGNK